MPEVVAADTTGDRNIAEVDDADEEMPEEPEVAAAVLVAAVQEGENEEAEDSDEGGGEEDEEEQEDELPSQPVPVRRQRSVRSTRGISPLDKWRFLGTMPTK